MEIHEQPGFPRFGNAAKRQNKRSPVLPSELLRPTALTPEHAVSRILAERVCEGKGTFTR